MAGGRKKEFDQRLAISFTFEQMAHLKILAGALNLSLSEVIRQSVNKLFKTAMESNDAKIQPSESRQVANL